tara:strand:+ start:2568 stop:2831 length:264 start_codon:yes stop_codon:yes gene_type:complete
MSDKIYVGKAKGITTKFGQITKLSFGPNDFEKLNAEKNAAGWVNLEILTGRDGNPYAQIDNFKPTAQGGEAKAAPVNQAAPSDDLPF